MTNLDENGKICIDTMEEWVVLVYKLLKDSVRQGEEKDTPEGTRFIQVSDTLASRLCELFENIMNNSLKEGEDEKTTVDVS